MTGVFSEMLHKRIVNDISAFDEAGHDLESILHQTIETLPHHGLGNRGALLDMLELLGIDSHELTEGNEVFNQFKEIIAANGYAYTVSKLEGRWWRSSFGPMLGVQKATGTFVPIMNKRFGYNYICERDDGTKEIVKVGPKTCSELEGFAYCFYRTLPSRKLTMKDFFKFIPKNLPKFHLWYVAGLALVTALLTMSLPYATKLIFEQVIPSGKSEGLIALMLVLLNIALTIGMLSTVRNKLFIGVKNIVSVVTQAALFERLFRLKPTFFRKESAGTITTQILGASEACERVSEGIITVVFTFLISLAYLVQIGIYSHFTAISYCIYGLMALNVACIYAGFKITNSIKMRRIPATSHFNGLVYNLLSGIQKIKTNGAEARAFRLWASEFKNTEVYNRWDATLPELSGTFSLSAILLMLLLIPSTDMSVSDFAAFFSAYCGLSLAITQMGLYTSEFTYILPTLNKITPILEAEPEVEESSKIVRWLSGSISVTNLRFRYNENMPYIFDGLNLNIRPGEYVALVGHSGCGKSTLLRLMLGFETPESGSVFYDQYGVFNVNKSSLRQHLGTCLQGGRLFSGTILDNVRISNPLATEEEVWEALRIAAVDEDVRNMTGGIHHELDANGQGLSGGQRQRILIARAVLNDPAVLFFDEATSALDNISQAKVIENLGRMNCTRITIAHRLSTIKDCDRIIVLDKGKVAEEGTFSELMAKGGIFAEIARRQIV